MEGENMLNRKKNQIVIALIILLCILTPPLNAQAAIIKEGISSNKNVYYVSSVKENTLAFHLIRNRMETNVKIVYKDKMIPSSKKDLKYYYSKEGNKCIFDLYQNLVLPYTNKTYACKGFSIKSAKYDKKKKTVTVEYKFEYYDSLEESDYTNKLVNEAIKKNIGNLKSDYQKAYWAYQFVLDHFQYDKTQSNYSVHSGFNEGTVCIGYATLYCSIMNKLGLECMVVEGSVYHDEFLTHAWNVIKLDGKWYCVDATWGDEDIPSKYFLKSKDTFLKEEYGVHQARIYDDFIKAGEIFSDTDYLDNNELSNHSILPAVYDVELDILKCNVLSINEAYYFMLQNKYNVPINFKSDDTKIAKVSEDGIIVGVGHGTTVITAYNDDLNIKQSITITVK